MNARDRVLGMDRAMTRRDFLNGVAVSAVGAMLARELIRAAEQEFAPERAAELGLTARRRFSTRRHGVSTSS